MDDGTVGVIFVLIIAITTYKIIALRHQKGGKSSDFQHQLSQELADRDDKSVALEERIRVLEKIVTENHKSSALSEEIDRLKEQTNE